MCVHVCTCACVFVHACVCACEGAPIPCMPATLMPCAYLSPFHAYLSVHLRTGTCLEMWSVDGWTHTSPSPIHPLSSRSSSMVGAGVGLHAAQTSAVSPPVCNAWASWLMAKPTGGSRCPWLGLPVIWVCPHGCWLPTRLLIAQVATRRACGCSLLREKGAEKEGCWERSVVLTPSGHAAFLH